MRRGGLAPFLWTNHLLSRVVGGKDGFMARGRRYSEEFKQEAVRLYRSSGVGYRKTAEDLGISAYALRKWVSDEGGSGKAPSSESEELRRLRRENRILREEREILRKTAVGSRGGCNTDRHVRVRRSVHATRTAVRFSA